MFGLVNALDNILSLTMFAAWRNNFKRRNCLGATALWKSFETRDKLFKSSEQLIYAVNSRTVHGSVQ